MEECKDLIWENELETNKLVSKAARIVLYFTLLVGFLNAIKVFDVVPGVINKYDFSHFF